MADIEAQRIPVIIVNSAFTSPRAEPHIDRKDYEDEIKKLLERDGPILVCGNHEVGKSDLVSKVFQNQQGIVHLSLDAPGVTAQAKLTSQLTAKDIGEVEIAFKAAEKVLNKKPGIVLDIPRRQRDPAVLDSVSTFSKVWGFDKEIKVLVMISAASTALTFDADGREQRIFVAALTEQNMESAQVTVVDVDGIDCCVWAVSMSLWCASRLCFEVTCSFLQICA